MQIDLTPFRRAFLDESSEHTAAMEEGLLKLESTPDDLELMNSIFRAAHSIKGGAGSFGIEAVAHFTHSVENLLDRLRNGEMTATRELIDILLRGTDVMKGLLDQARAVENGGTAEPVADVDEVLAELAKHLGGAASPAAAAPVAAQASAPTATRFKVTFQPSPTLFRTGSDPYLLLRELASLGKVLSTEVDSSALPEWSSFEPETCYLSWKIELESEREEADLKDVFLFVSDDATIAIERVEEEPDPLDAITAATPAAASAASASADAPRSAVVKAARTGGESASIRVSVEKVDQLINVIGELVIAQSMVADVVNNFSADRLTRLREAVLSVERNTRDLQERVMAVRMVPIGSIFSRYPRIVRDLAAQLGKDVSLELEGEDTELDKGVVEKIGDPLTHLIRNSLDHGVEKPEVREAAGKPRTGVIKLRAFTEGGSVFVEIEDDGAGLDTDRIRQKGVERGLLRPDDTWTPEQIHQLIFQASFSTAAQVTDVSGRGVGMDVVKKNVESLGGSVTIASQRGKGARFRIKLPLTLAILDGLTLSIGQQMYILPLVSIVESFRPTGASLKTLLTGGEVVIVRGETLPVLRGHRLLGVCNAITDPTRGLLVIVESDGRRVALLVDELCGQQQVVIKNLDANFRRVDGVMGATIMGDGRVALILDVPGLMRLAGSGVGVASYA